MSDALSCSEMDGQHAELLPARTVLSMFHLDDGDSTVIGSACETSTSPGNGGLLGLGAVAPFSTVTCEPAALVDNT
ncbi:MAG TPA: hypothetical protein VN748_19965 [Pseudonocardiaceae bacterium]|jgi:hypothetical protein|nr:hypothetical protein [Pseudonocardiaceae bacterium]